MVAVETNSPSGPELGCGLITGNVQLGTKTAVLHFNKKEPLHIPEVLYLCDISSVQLRQKRNPDSHKCVVAKMASEDRCTEIKCAVTNLVREA